MKNNDTPLKWALHAAALASVLFIGAAKPSTAGLQQQPPATQPPAPTVQQPPATQPVPQGQPPAQVPQPTPNPAAPEPPVTPPPAPPGTTGQPAQTQTPNRATPNGGTLVLLDRISDLVDQALGAKPAAKGADNDKGTPGAKATSGTVKVGKTTAGTVNIDRAVLDEIKAEVGQLKIMLQDKEP